MYICRRQFNPQSFSDNTSVVLKFSVFLSGEHVREKIFLFHPLHFFLSLIPTTLWENFLSRERIKFCLPLRLRAYPNDIVFTVNFSDIKNFLLLIWISKYQIRNEREFFTAEISTSRVGVFSRDYNLLLFDEHEAETYQVSEWI